MFYDADTGFSKGEVALPGAIRRKLGLMAGDELDARIQGGSILMTPRRIRTAKPSIVRDPITGLAVLSAGPDAPRLPSGQVSEILAEFR